MPMISRLLEPEVMDTPEEAWAYDQMDHSAVNRKFAEDLLSAGGELIERLQRVKTPRGDGTWDVLDLGTGTAQIPIEVARRTRRLTICAVDAADSMLDIARQNIRSARLSRRIECRLVDAKRLPFRKGQFQIVMSNSIVHHIPEPDVVLKEAIRVTAPGGLIFFRDLMRPNMLRQLRQIVDRYAADATDHQRRLFTESLRAALTLKEIRDKVAALGADPRQVEATSDRHWTWVCFVEKSKRTF